ncbi:MAG: hypothetical protein IPP98_05175 [Gemmatimonadetes bacterium]|nr:hypothetical protein [Gemmatimonadota bacterium]
MTIRAAAAAFWLVPAALGAQESATRWAVQLRTAAGVEFADLRLDGARSRLLLESHDSVFFPLTNLQRTGNHLSFGVGALGLRAELDVDGDGAVMSGRLRYADGGGASWEGELIRPGTVRWPVRPRVRVRQLAVGTRANATVIPAAWAAALSDSMTLEREYAELVRRTGLPVVRGGERVNRSRAMALGADEATRAAVRRQLQAISGSVANDSTFQRLFLVRGAGIVIDVHERAEAFAASRDPSYRHAAALRALRGGAPDQGDADLARLREAAYALWPAWERGDSLLRQRVAALAVTDSEASRSLTALLDGYISAVPWWREAVGWLLTHPWLETAGVRQAPAQLVAAFWGRSVLPPPKLVTEWLGGFEAMPLVSGDRLARTLVEPANASAREWLPAGRLEALTAWFALTWSDTLTLSAAGGDVALLPPSRVPGLKTLLATADGIRIDPGIMPLLAVATVIHEWHHVLAAVTRLEGKGVSRADGSTVARLLEDDPWLAEGFAEWATEETLRPAAVSTPLLLLLDAEKRMALWGGMSEDPHALGYRLVRSAAARLPVATRRSTFVSRLHDPTAVARLANFPAGARGAPLLLRRPVTAAVVPEITLTWDAGVADAVARRLLFPPYPPEH